MKTSNKILISGADGFIGGHLFDRLLTKYGLLNLMDMDKNSGRSTSDYWLTRRIVEVFQPDMIVHLGANCSSQVSLRDPRTDFIDNAVGTFNICEVSRENKIPIIFNSTMKIYPGEDGLISPYGQSKLVGEAYLKLYNQIYGVPYIINRPSSVYGPRQNASEDGGWFTHFIISSLKEEPITLFGDGTQSRDGLYIDDHIDLLVDQIEHFDTYKNDEYDFGGGPDNEVSLNELLDELDYHNTQTAPKLPGDVQRFVCDNKKITSVNGWKPKTHWREGMEKTKEWFTQQL